MGWAAIIASLLEIFGPALKKLIERWLERKLKKSADKLRFTSFGDEHLARNALLDKAIEDTNNPLKKRLLERIKNRSIELGVTSSGTLIEVNPEMLVDINVVSESIEAKGNIDADDNDN